MNPTRTLDRLALDAHRRGDTWATFWASHAEQVRAVDPYNREAYRGLVNRLLCIVVSGTTSGMEPAGEPWLLDGEPEQTQPADVGTAAKIDWTAAGIVNQGEAAS